MRKKITLKSIVKIVTAFFLLLAIYGTVLYCTNLIEKNLKNQLEQNLEDVARQNALTLYNQIHAKHQVLESMILQLMQMDGDMAENVNRLDTLAEYYGLVRLGYCSPDGRTNTTDGVVADLSFRDFFQRGMKGKGTITGVLQDAMSEAHENITIMSAPMFDEKQNILGVFGITYSCSDFNDTLAIECFEGRGYSCAVNEKGEIMVAMGNENFQLSHNLFTNVLSQDKRNEKSIEQLKALMEEKKEGGGSFYISGENYYYCVPVSLMDGEATWYMLTIVPETFLAERMAPIQKNLHRMHFFSVVIILAGIVLFILLSRERQRTIMRLAYIDPLTGGPNYAKFSMDMEGKRMKQGYMVSMDIANFNNINIAAGKSCGDEMLKSIWEVLRSILKEGEKAGRVREDRFVAFLAASDKQALAERLKELSKRIRALARDLQVPGIRPYFGIYQMPSGESVDDAHSKAELAGGYIKGNPKKNHAFYDEIDYEKLMEIQRLEEKFEDALKNHAFEVWYQPKYSAASKKLVGSEALVRWRDNDGNLISPGKFIPLLERNGAIARLDEYVFRNVCVQQKKWESEGIRIYPVSVNLSRASLFYADIVEKYQTILADYELDSRFIQLEVTESAVEGRENIAELLGQFRDIGVRILMDDFGTGYSSLSTLNMDCFDTLKLDKSLIDHIGDRKGETLLSHVIHMGREMGLHITAEGVENGMQLEYLCRLECDDIQGFYFAKPMPTREYEEILGAQAES